MNDQTPSWPKTHTPPGVSGNTGRTGNVSALLDTLSPGRYLPWSAPAFVPTPDASLTIIAGGTCYYPIACYNTEAGTGELAVLGFRAHLFSPFAFKASAPGARTHVAFGEARLTEFFDAGTIAQGQLYPWATPLGYGASLVIASGTGYRDWQPGKWVATRERSNLTHTLQGEGVSSRPSQATDPEHRVELAFPPGDISAASGAGTNNLERTSREQPFAVRLQEGMALVVALAIDARYVSQARDATPANTKSYFPIKAHGELFVATPLDDRRLR